MGKDGKDRKGRIGGNVGNVGTEDEKNEGKGKPPGDARGLFSSMVHNFPSFPTFRTFRLLVPQFDPLNPLALGARIVDPEGDDAPRLL